MKQCYVPTNFRRASVALIEQINAIVDEYLAMGYRLTVRQIYYQTIARDILPDSWVDEVYNKKNGLPPNTKNTQKNYDKLQQLLNDARLAGEVDWDAIEDRTREFIRRSRWFSARDIVNGAAEQFHMDLWRGQRYRLFCLVEKEALAGVLERACHQWDIPLLPARGYPSASVLREFALKDLGTDPDEIPVLLHLGDHDPSGMDMSRDLADRLEMFAESDFEFKRLALNMGQIRKLKPPPNPAKITDCRFAKYLAKYGPDSWELDALNPAYLTKLIDDEANKYIDKKIWDARLEVIESERTKIVRAAKRM